MEQDFDKLTLSVPEDAPEKEKEKDEKLQSQAPCENCVDCFFNKLPLSLFVDRLPMTFERLHDKFPLCKITNFLTPDDCEYLIEYGRNNPLQRSSMLIEGETAYSDRRTSSTTFLTRDGQRSPIPVLADIQLLVSSLCYVPVSHIEGVNLTRYEKKGDEFKEHHDYFGDDTKQQGKAGDRMATYIVYLNTVAAEHKGRTLFPRLNVAVQPEQGSAIFWPNTNMDNTLHFAETLHAGEALEGGEKWVLNIWIRQRSYF